MVLIVEVVRASFRFLCFGGRVRFVDIRLPVLFLRTFVVHQSSCVVDLLKLKIVATLVFDVVRLCENEMRIVVALEDVLFRTGLHCVIAVRQQVRESIDPIFGEITGNCSKNFLNVS